MKQRKRTLANSTRLSYLLMIASMSAFFIVGLSMSLVFYFTRIWVIFFVMLGVLAALLLGFVASVLFNYRLVHQTYYRDVLGTTVQNYQSLSKNEPDLREYNNPMGFEELEVTNQTVRQIGVLYDRATLVPFHPSFKGIPIIYEDKARHVVKLKTFKEQFQNIVLSSMSYRNMLIDAYYIIDEPLEKDEEDFLIDKLNESFQGYGSYLIAPRDDGKSFYIYLPHIDSISDIEDKLSFLISICSVMRRGHEGLSPCPVHFSAVCYPYSNMEDMFSDLAYSRRRGEPLDIYFPTHSALVPKTSMRQKAIDINYLSRILEHLADLEARVSMVEENRKTILKTLSHVMNYLHIDHAGTIVYQSDAHRYVSHLVTDGYGKSPLFPSGEEVETEFVEALSRHRDIDRSYLFSDRAHCSNELGPHFDRHGIASGIYYVVEIAERTEAIFYFFNEERSLDVDSYLRETIVILFARIGEYFASIRRELEVNESFQNVNAIMRLSNFSSYRIDPITYALLSHSIDIPEIFPGCKRGEPCYKTFYGFEAPCQNCPLKTKKKMVSHASGHTYEVSLTLSERHTIGKRFLMRQVASEGDRTQDRYDQDLLISGYPALVQTLTNAFALGGRGYLLLLRIDNMRELLDRHGSEGVLFALRSLTGDIASVRKLDQLYYYNPETIAVFLPDAGQIDAINHCEAIFEKSRKQVFSDGESEDLSISYLCFNYPRGYASAYDFMRAVENYYSGNSYKRNDDRIYFSDSDYTRAASAERFMIDVIEEQFANKTYNVALQPMVRAKDRVIDGAELLLRIGDSQRKIVLNTDTLVKAAARNGRIGLISEALTNYIGEFYRDFGASTFRSLGFNRLTINTDFSYFQDEDLLQKINKLVSDYDLPRNFLGFEIAEDEVASHMREFEDLSKKLARANIVLSCDQYSGKYIPMSRLAALGFTQVKIGRFVAGYVDSDPAKAEMARSLMDEAKSCGLNVCFVGVENIDQYHMLRDYDSTCHIQGYYFYKPLDREDLLLAIRERNSK